MQNNQLFIEVDGVYQEVDLLNEEIPINIQSFNVDDLENRAIDYTQAVKIPTTANNNKKFKHANVFTTYSDIQDKSLNCKLYVSGMEVLGLGSILKVLSITDLFYECQITGNLSAFVALIKAKNNEGKEKTINDLSFTSTITRSYNSFVDYDTAQGQDLFYAICDFDKTDEGIYSSNFGAKYLVADNQKPFIWYKTVLDKILDDNGGYTLVTNVNEGDINNIAMPLASIKAEVDYDSLLETGQGVTPASFRTYDDGAFGYITPTIDTPAISEGIRVNTTNSLYTVGVITNVANGLRYEAQTTGDYVFNINLELKSNFPNPSNNFDPASVLRLSSSVLTFTGEIMLSIYVNGVEQQTFKSTFNYFYSAYKLNVQTGVYEFTFKKTGNDTLNLKDTPVTLKLNNGDNVVFCVKNNMFDTEYMKPTGFLQTTINAYSFDLVNIIPKVGIVDMGLAVSVKNNLPEITQWEFFKSFLQNFCLITNIDNYEKKIYAYNFNSIINNKEVDFEDWTDKIEDKTGTINNLPPFARKNIIRYKPTERDSNDEGFVVLTEEQAEDIFDKGIIIYWAETEGDYTANPKVLEYGTTSTESSFPSGQYKYLTLPNVIEKSDLTITDEGYLFCNNEGLPEEKVIIELPFEAVEFYSSDDKNDLVFNYAKFRDCEENVLKEYKTPRLVTIEGDYVFDIKSSEGADRTGVSLPVASPINSRSIKTTYLVSNYYSAFQDSVLTNYRKIEDLVVDLREGDIQTFSPYVPIYIEKYGAYFYVNKIKDYMKDKLTKVDLIKI